MFSFSEELQDVFNVPQTDDSKLYLKHAEILLQLNIFEFFLVIQSFSVVCAWENWATKKVIKCANACAPETAASAALLSICRIFTVTQGILECHYRLHTFLQTVCSWISWTRIQSFPKGFLSDVIYNGSFRSIAALAREHVLKLFLLYIS